MLGDSLVSQISIDSISITGGALNIRRRHGRITLDSICVAGGRPRLFDPTASLLRVEGRTLHAEADELIISDLLGRRIPALTTAYASTMTAHVPDDVHGLVLITIMQNSRAYLRTLWFN
jgi:aminoglycoside phosphotransferase family enzyme